DELELVAHRRELGVELRDRGRVELLLPVEGRRAVVGQELVRVLRANGFSELLRLREIRLGRLAPDEIRVGSVSQPAREGAFEPALDLEEALDRAATCQELLVARVVIAREQMRAVGVRASDEAGRYVENVRGEASRHELLDELSRRDQDLATHVAALLG